jgi:hypothetical protein
MPFRFFWIDLPTDEMPSNAIRDGYQYQEVTPPDESEAYDKAVRYQRLCRKRGNFKHAKVDYWNGFLAALNRLLMSFF